MTLPSTVLITGAGGFIGRHIHDRLVAEGVEVRGLDLVADPARGIRGGDTVHVDRWKDLLAGVDAVVHTAATVSNVAPLDEAWTVNVLGTNNVMRAAAAAGVDHFVHVSSIAAFGETFPDGVTEDYPPHLTGFSYADTKINGEAVVLAAHAAGDIECTIVRPGDVYGPGSRPWVLIPIQLIRSRQAILPDRGKGIFSPTYIDNLVDGIIACLDRPEARGQIFTLTDGIGITCWDYFNRLAELVGGSVYSLPGPLARTLALSVGTVTRAVGKDSELGHASIGMLTREGTYSIDKARRMLDYEPAVDIDEGMRRVAAWLDAQGLR